MKAIKRHIVKVLSLLLVGLGAFSPVYAEENNSGDVSQVLTEIEGKGLVVVSPPNQLFLENNELKTIKTNEYNLYLTNMKYNNEYGIIIAVQHYLKDMPESSFALHVENGVIASPEQAKDISWYYTDFVPEYKGGSLDNSPTSVGIAKNIKSGSLIQYGVLYKLKDKDKIKVSYGTIQEPVAEVLLTTDDTGVVKEQLQVGNLTGVTFKKEVPKETYLTQEQLANEESREQAKKEEGRDSYKKEVKESKVETKKKRPILFYIVGGVSLLLGLITVIFAMKYVK